jgi:hypothetical protein
MRKISLILAVLLLAAPAWATVNITCSQDGNEVTVSYEVTGEPNKVRAFALDIVIDNPDVNIVAVDDTVNAYYTIFPGSVVISNGEITEQGSAVAAESDYPDDTQPGLGSSGITIEMGALYYPTDDSSPNAPPNQGDLLKFYVEEIACTVTISENNARGGVVLTDPAEDPTVNAPGCELTFEECLIGGNAGPNEKSDWDAWGKPDCWCYQRQCRGDADGQIAYGTYWVLTSDLDALANSFAKDDATCQADPNCTICADFDHKQQYGTYRVLTDDLDILATYFANTSVPVCDQAPIITGPYNFWTN